MLAVLAVGVIAAALAYPRPAAAGSPAAIGPQARAAAQSFLTRFMRPDGRVVRLDQGSDTVSAGQSQALLVAVAIGDHTAFDRVWRWTRRHLERPDHLLASRWVAGRTADPQPASDADLDAARALVLAGPRFRVPSYRRAGLRLARAALARETIVRGGSRVLLAGPWARSRGIVEPGYWAPMTFELLARATGDRRFLALERSVIALASKLTAGSPHLPPDWATVSPSGAAAAIAAPPGHPAAPPQYSIDAARLPLRFAETCSAASRAVSAAAWPLFGAEGPGGIGVTYGLDGAIRDRDQAAITLLGAAAAAHAAGAPAARDALFAQAQAIDARFPTYYGAAWLALGQIELTSKALGSCS